MMQKKKKNTAKEMTITGMVEEFDSQEDGMGILIAADDGENYVVEPNKIGKKLNASLDEKVKVKGLVTQDRDGLLYIAVSSFKVFEIPEEFDDRYDDEDRYADRYDDGYDDGYDYKYQDFDR
jgi:hypothetical protein